MSIAMEDLKQRERRIRWERLAGKARKRGPMVALVFFAFLAGACVMRAASPVRIVEKDHFYPQKIITSGYEFTCKAKEDLAAWDRSCKKPHR